jgi:sec-independent protein translocase protein TatA
MWNIGISELLVILIIALIVFGPGKLPEVGKALGRAIGEFKKASRDMLGENKDDEWKS